MSIADLVAQLAVDWEAVATLSGIMAVGVFLFTMALKVFGILKDGAWTGRAALIIAGVEGAFVVAGLFFPAAIPLGVVVYATALAASAAGLFYKGLAKPIINKLVGEDVMSTEALSPES